MASKLVVLACALGLLFLGAAVARTSAWTPRAPAPLPERAWAPTVDPEPSNWQTLDHVPLDAGGGRFVAELMGFRTLTGSGETAFVVKVIRTGGIAAPILVSRGVLDGDAMLRAETTPDGVEVMFTFSPFGPGNYSIAADLDVRVWHAVALGFRELPPVHLTLRTEGTSRFGM